MHCCLTGFCFEAQGFPNAVNTPTFPSVIVNPGEVSVRVKRLHNCEVVPVGVGGVLLTGKPTHPVPFRQELVCVLS